MSTELGRSSLWRGAWIETTDGDRMNELALSLLSMERGVD